MAAGSARSCSRFRPPPLSETMLLDSQAEAEVSAEAAVAAEAAAGAEAGVTAVTGMRI